MPQLPGHCLEFVWTPDTAQKVLVNLLVQVEITVSEMHASFSLNSAISERKP